MDVEGILGCHSRLPHDIVKAPRVIPGDPTAAPHHTLELGTLADWDWEGEVWMEADREVVRLEATDD